MKQYVNTTQLQNTVFINTLHVDNFHIFNTNDFLVLKGVKICTDYHHVINFHEDSHDHTPASN